MDYTLVYSSSLWLLCSMRYFGPHSGYIVFSLNLLINLNSWIINNLIIKFIKIIKKFKIKFKKLNSKVLKKIKLLKFHNLIAHSIYGTKKRFQNQVLHCSQWRTYFLVLLISFQLSRQGTPFLALCVLVWEFFSVKRWM